MAQSLKIISSEQIIVGVKNIKATSYGKYVTDPELVLMYYRERSEHQSHPQSKVSENEPEKWWRCVLRCGKHISARQFHNLFSEDVTESTVAPKIGIP